MPTNRVRANESFLFLSCLCVLSSICADILCAESIVIGARCERHEYSLFCAHQQLRHYCSALFCRSPRLWTLLSLTGSQSPAREWTTALLSAFFLSAVFLFFLAPCSPPSASPSQSQNGCCNFRLLAQLFLSLVNELSEEAVVLCASLSCRRRRLGCAAQETPKSLTTH